MRNTIRIIVVVLGLAGAFPGMAQIDVTNEGELFVQDGQLVHIEGNFTNKSSDLVNLGDIGLTGNFWNESSVPNPGNGIFRFIGTEEQNLFLLDTMAFFELEVNNPNGLTLSGDAPAEVHEHLYFEDGIIRTDASSMVFFQPFATYSDARDFAHIDGPVMRRGETDFVFPVGKGGVLRAPGVSEVSSPTTFLAEYFNFSYSTLETDFTLNKVNDQEYWQVERLDTDATAKVMLPYDENTGLVNDLEDLHMAYFNDDDLWTKREAISDGASPLLSLVSQEFIAQFGFFTTAEDRSYLADRVEISVVQDEECVILVNWVVPPDYPITLYEIERSIDSINFEKIGEIVGDSIPFADYRLMWFADTDLYRADEIFYRMKITFPDGTTTYTNIDSVENNCPFVDCQIFPNPVSSYSNLNIRVEAEAEKEMVLRIYSVPGRLIWEQTLELKIGRHDYEILTEQLRLPAAPYFLYINPRKSMKFIVIK